MNKIKNLGNTFVALLLLMGTGIATYQFLLTADAKDNLKNALTSVNESYKKLTQVAEEMRGIVVEEDASLPNRERTLDQWKKLGY